MNHLVMSLAWCWLQVMIVAFLAIFFSALAMRRSPASGATIASAGIVAALVLTLLAPARVPQVRWGMGISIPSSIAPDARSPRVANRATSHGKQFGRNADKPPAGFAMHLPLLDTIILSAQSSQTVIAIHGGTARMLLGMLAVATLFSLARVAWGLWGVAKLYRGSRVLVDDHLAAVVQESAIKFGLRQLPAVRESSLLVSAAVVGMWRPVVLIPGAWRQWTTAELRAVIAHELAHIRRRDLVVRTVAALTVAVQCTHPLVYWLRRQLMLAQEMAADELAASVLGNRTEYLHALSRLALRQDGRPIDRSVGLVLPVFSGFLVRRIEMLRAKDGSTCRAIRPLLQWTAIGLMVAATAGTTAIRGLAQKPEGQSNGSIPAGRTSDNQRNPVAVAADSHSSAALLFQRPSFDPAAISGGANGGFFIRLRELSQHATFAELAHSLYVPFVAHWKDLFPTAEPPDWSMEEIEYVAGDLFFSVKPLSQPTEDGSNQVMFGAHYVVVRWQKPLDGQFESLLRIPGATKKSHEGTVFVELPIIPALGPTLMCACQLDDRALLVAQSQTLLFSRLNQLRSAAPRSQDWHKAWKVVDRGLAAIVASDAHIVRPLGEPVDDDARAYSDFFTHARVLAVGLDRQDQPDGVSAVKMQFRTDTEKNADLMRSLISTFIERTAASLRVKRGDFENNQASPNEKAIQAINTMVESLHKARIATRQSDDGWVVEVQIAGALDDRPLWVR
jgi:beta-lactamase regulating signal transducer with metallopeptidase domain